MPDRPANYLAAARLAAEAYRRADLSAGHAQAAMERQGPTCLIAFRGTDEAADWATNLDARPKYVNRWDGTVHGGFFAAWAALSPSVLAATAGCDAVAVAGHSLGGALAQMAALDLAQAGRAVRAVVTLGAPRVGRRDWARAYGAAPGLAGVTVHVRRAGDLVPALPFWHWGFRHTAGRVHWIDERERMHEGAPWWRPLVDTAQAWARHVGRDGPAVVERHAVGGYLAAMEAA